MRDTCPLGSALDGAVLAVDRSGSGVPAGAACEGVASAVVRALGAGVGVVGGGAGVLVFSGLRPGWESSPGPAQAETKAHKPAVSTTRRVVEMFTPIALEAGPQAGTVLLRT